MASKRTPKKTEPTDPSTPITPKAKRTRTRTSLVLVEWETPDGGKLPCMFPISSVPNKKAGMAKVSEIGKAGSSYQIVKAITPVLKVTEEITKRVVVATPKKPVDPPADQPSDQPAPG